VPKRADLFGVLCAFVVVYCALENRWEPLASLALILAAFAVALPRMVGAWEVGSKGVKGHFPPTVEGEFERLKPPRPPGPALAQEKGSPED
jgi:hypothetical protein